MKAIYTVLILIYPFIFFAQNRGDLDYYFKMFEINEQWRNHLADCPIEKIQFDSDIDAIQAHLYLVCKSLIKNTPQALSEQQRAKRLRLIEELADYAHEQVFPTNLYHATRTPYFVDDFEVHCAVGYLMKQSGYTDLVTSIRASENYSLIEDISTPGVAEWADAHGFILDELKWIQPGYAPQSNVFPVGAGANGNVRKMLASSNQGLIIVGDFDTLDAQPCSQIGKFQNNQLACLGSGLNGVLNGVSNGFFGPTAYGQFEVDGSTFSLAYFNQGEWTYANVPNREGYIAQTGFWGGGWSNSIEIVLYHPDNPDLKEIWIKVDDSTWIKAAHIYGDINKIDASPLGRLYVGKFDQLITFNANDEISDTIQAANAVFRAHSNEISWTGITGAYIMPDEVNDFVVINTQIYFAGSCSNNQSSSGVLLSRYLNNTLQPLLFYGNGFMMNNETQSPSINSVFYESVTGSLLIGGDFSNIEATMGIIGSNLARYKIALNSFEYVAILNKPVYVIKAAFPNQSILVGGEFTFSPQNALNHLGVLNGFSGIYEQTSAFELYPNPFIDVLHVIGVSGGASFQILDLNGRVVHQGIVHESSTIDLSDLVSGVYVLHIQLESGVVNTRIVKQ